jgi:hypothetical protein
MLRRREAPDTITDKKGPAAASVEAEPGPILSVHVAAAGSHQNNESRTGGDDQHLRFSRNPGPQSGATHLLPGPMVSSLPLAAHSEQRLNGADGAAVDHQASLASRWSWRQEARGGCLACHLNGCLLR